MDHKHKHYLAAPIIHVDYLLYYGIPLNIPTFPYKWLLDQSSPAFVHCFHGNSLETEVYWQLSVKQNDK